MVEFFGEPVAKKVAEWLGHKNVQTINVGDGQLVEPIMFHAATPDRTADAAEEAIIRAAFPVMHRAGMLVMPHVERMQTFGGGMTQVSTLKAIECARLIDLMAKSASWANARNRRKDSSEPGWRMAVPARVGDYLDANVEGGRVHIIGAGI
jgi:hypothetical protein